MMFDFFCKKYSLFVKNDEKVSLDIEHTEALGILASDTRIVEKVKDTGRRLEYKASVPCGDISGFKSCGSFNIFRVGAENFQRKAFLAAVKA